MRSEGAGQRSPIALPSRPLKKRAVSIVFIATRTARLGDNPQRPLSPWTSCCALQPVLRDNRPDFKDRVRTANAAVGEESARPWIRRSGSHCFLDAIASTRRQLDVNPASIAGAGHRLPLPGPPLRSRKGGGIPGNPANAPLAHSVRPPPAGAPQHLTNIVIMPFTAPEGAIPRRAIPAPHLQQGSRSDVVPRREGILTHSWSRLVLRRPIARH